MEWTICVWAAFLVRDPKPKLCRLALEVQLQWAWWDPQLRQAQVASLLGPTPDSWTWETTAIKMELTTKDSRWTTAIHRISALYTKFLEIHTTKAAPMAFPLSSSDQLITPWTMALSQVTTQMTTVINSSNTNSNQLNFTIKLLNNNTSAIQIGLYFSLLAQWLPNLSHSHLQSSLVRSK